MSQGYPSWSFKFTLTHPCVGATDRTLLCEARCSRGRSSDRVCSRKSKVFLFNCSHLCFFLLSPTITLNVDLVIFVWQMQLFRLAKPTCASCWPFASSSFWGSFAETRASAWLAAWTIGALRAALLLLDRWIWSYWHNPWNVPCATCSICQLSTSTWPWSFWRLTSQRSRSSQIFHSFQASWSESIWPCLRPWISA